ncbi:hypothetical protein DFS34DRAFT_584846 [Phlyctochytrium arcticum]|nr:hypothetical protein DFS34DRAFT_584846 [Phlyctochytrium arcticum]
MVSSKFKLEATVPFPLPAAPTEIHTYKHIDSDFRLVFCPLPGPLCQIFAIVPTVGEGDEGLAHTLEHLVFCGSEGIPHRGYLDNLATRCLSDGTNAYTSEDHTAYFLTTAGSEGLVDVLPVYIDHILHPTLRDNQFVTEVYHLDGEAKHQGVVYCEMAGRENSEWDRQDLVMRRLLYGTDNTYSRECGGLTREIRKLTNEQIKQYHRKYYHLDNLTVVITGQVDPQTVFQKIEENGRILTAKSESVEIPPIVLPQFSAPSGNIVKETVKFQSSDEEMGSIAYGWRGPPSEDVFTTTALEVLLRFFIDTAASPFPQAFTERANPLASQVSYSVSKYVQTSIQIKFSGVPFKKEDEGDDMDVDGEESDENEDSEEEDENSEDEDEDGDGDESDVDEEELFEGDTYHKRLMEVLQRALSGKSLNADTIRSAIRLHRRKTLEMLEEDALGAVSTYISVDVVRYALANASTIKDTKAQGAKPVLTTQAPMFEILDELEKKPVSFWVDLAKQWFVNAPVAEVKTIPDVKMAEEHTQNETEEQTARVQELGEAGLERLKKAVDEAVEENKIDLPDHLVAQMPPVPDVTKAAKLGGAMYFADLDRQHPTKAAKRPFSACQIVETETVFTHLRIALHTESLPDDLRSYLYLFEGLIFQSPLTLPGPDGKTTTVDYRDVVRRATDLFVSYSAAVGIDDGSSDSWLCEVFSVNASAESADFEAMAAYLIQCFLFTTFTKERLVTTAKNLLSQFVESKRDGSFMVDVISGELLDPAVPVHTVEKNNRALGLFRQEQLLKQCLKACKDGAHDTVLAKLEKIKTLLLLGATKEGPSFVQIGLPTGSTVAAKTSLGKDQSVAKFAEIWDREFAAYRKLQSTATLDNSTGAATVRPSAFPYPRVPYNPQRCNRELFGSSLLVPIPGVTTSYLSQTVPCEVLRPHPHSDYFAVRLLTELLSRIEGPLYTAIRGQGFAYGQGVGLDLWNGTLEFSLYKSSEPQRALFAFYTILIRLGNSVGFDDVCSATNIETARASIAFMNAQRRATSSSVVAGSLKGALKVRPFINCTEREQIGLNLAY